MNDVNIEIVDLNKKVFSNFEKLCDEVYIYRSMLTKKECEDLIVEAKSDKTAELFYVEEKVVGGKYKVSTLDKYKARLSNLIDYKNQNSISKELFMSSNDWDHCLLKIDSGGDPIHVDVYNYIDETLRNASINKSDSKYKEMKLPFATTLLYLSEDFDGGEIFYPEYDLLYKPAAGDLLVHNSQIVHSVNPISNGERWNHMNAFSALFFISDNDLDYYFKKHSGWWREENNVKEVGAKGKHEKSKEETFYLSLNQKPVRHKRLISYAKKNNIDLDSYGKY